VTSSPPNGSGFGDPVLTPPETSSTATPSTAPPLGPSILDPSRPFGGHRLVRLVGQGGFAEVWEAERIADGRRVALKLLRRELTEELRHRFRLEGRLAASLSHPRTVYIFSADVVEGHPVITMELMTGGTLQDSLDRDGAMSAQGAVDAILDVIEGLEGAARVGIIHRDVKPSNCFLDGSGRVKIGDFGIARSSEFSSHVTASGVFVGTPAFASPEQFLGQQATHQSDQYSVGATLYALLTGHPPFRSSTPGDLLVRVVSQSPTAFSKHGIRVPRALRSIVLRLLAKDPAHRYPSYASLTAALRPLSSRDTLAPEPVRRFGAYLFDITLSTMVVALLLSAMSGISFFDWIQRPTLPPLVVAAAGFMVPVLLFGALEALWHRTPGKAIFGLYVLSASGKPPTPGSIFIRNVSFWGLSGLSGWVSLFAPEAVAPLTLLGAALPCFTMRQSNGYAGIHELLSGTRVRAVRASSTVGERSRLPGEIPPPDSNAPRRGPYRLVRNLWSTDRESLSLAFDDQLARHVWIREATAAPDEGVVDPWTSRTETDTVTRPSRLHWLQDGNDPGRRWSAFEAPSGATLRDYIAEQGPRDWSETRELLLQLLIEMEAGRLDSSDSERLSLDHLWVDGNGRLKILPFRMARPQGDDGAVDRTPGFPWLMAAFCLDGRCEPMATPLRAPIPVRARVFLESALRGPLRGSDLTSAIQGLRELTLQPATVSRAVRVTQLLCAWTLPGIATVGAFAGSYGSLVARARGDQGPAFFAFATVASLDLALVVLGIAALPSLVLAYLFRGGPLLAVFGMRVRDAHGAMAGRARCLARAGIAMSPVLLVSLPAWIVAAFGLAAPATAVVSGSGPSVVSRIAATVGATLRTLPDGIRMTLLLSGAVLAIVFVVGIVAAVLRPDRGLHDQAAGTRLVPR